MKVAADRPDEVLDLGYCLNGHSVIRKGRKIYPLRRFDFANPLMNGWKSMAVETVCIIAFVLLLIVYELLRITDHSLLPSMHCLIKDQDWTGLRRELVAQRSLHEIQLATNPRAHQRVFRLPISDCLRKFEALEFVAKLRQVPDVRVADLRH
jgi:hypothetical protein